MYLYKIQLLISVAGWFAGAEKGGKQHMSL